MVFLKSELKISCYNRSVTFYSEWCAAAGRLHLKILHSDFQKLLHLKKKIISKAISLHSKGADKSYMACLQMFLNDRNEPESRVIKGSFDLSNPRQRPEPTISFRSVFV